MLPKSCFGLLRPHLNLVFALIIAKLESGMEVSDGCKSYNFADTQESVFMALFPHLKSFQFPELQFKIISAISSDGGLLF